MARINVGIDPSLLSDQHLIAESVEITMIPGHLRRYNWQMKTDPPAKFKLGKGHINFFKPKLRYLQRRLNAVNLEMQARGFNPGTSMKEFLEESPSKYQFDWRPTEASTYEVRCRIAQRLKTRTNGKDGTKFYKYKRSLIPDMDLFIDNMMNSKLFYV